MVYPPGIGSGLQKHCLRADEVKRLHQHNQFTVLYPSAWISNIRDISMNSDGSTSCSVAGCGTMIQTDTGDNVFPAPAPALPLQTQALSTSGIVGQCSSQPVTRSRDNIHSPSIAHSLTHALILMDMYTFNPSS